MKRNRKTGICVSFRLSDKETELLERLGRAATMANGKILTPREVLGTLLRMSLELGRQLEKEATEKEAGILLDRNKSPDGNG